MVSPWQDPGAIDRGVENISALHEDLLGFLSGYLNEAHGVRHEARYWRILVGPWLLGYTSAIVDHGLHLNRAFEMVPNPETWTLDFRDHYTPIDTADFASHLNADVFQLQLYSEMLESRGVGVKYLRCPAFTSPSPASFWAKAAIRGVWARAVRVLIGPDRIFSDFYASPRQTFALMRAASLVPLGSGVASRYSPVDVSRRARLCEFRSSVPFAVEAAALLSRHLPVLFLEGHVDFRRAVLARWPRLPRLLLTSVGWYSNETFKLLAAEATEQGAELVISQHGGGYGMMDPILSEAHERRVADRYLTWGWSDLHYPGAKLRALPNPKMSFKPGRRKRRTGQCLLISTTVYRYPYSCYFASAPAAHRYADQIAERTRFIRGLAEEARAGLHLRLHHADLGWGHRARLVEEFPHLAFDEDPEPWINRADRFDLVVIDHPQTSILESLALDIPTLLFWNPALWRMRREALEILDGLRHARLLLDSPEEAALNITAIMADPASWWARPAARSARAAFCKRYARSSANWIADWTQALKEGGP